jgi:Uncharacterized conserved protein containing a coiled-coil domain
MSSQLKQRFLKLLKEDEEFRYAVAGLLGLEEILKRLDRHEEQLVKLREDMNRGFELIERRISALGARWGLQTEEAFREGLKGILEKEFGVKIERWIEKDKEGMVYDHPSDVELDVVKDGKTMLIEVSSHVKASDIPIFRRKAEFYEKITGVRADRLVIVTPTRMIELLRWQKSLELKYTQRYDCHDACSYHPCSHEI